MVLALVGIALVVSRRPSASMQGAVVEPFALPLVANAPTERLMVPGDDVLVLEFFASWCRACRTELPRAQVRGRALPVQFVAISLDDTPDAAKSIIDAWGLTAPIAFDDQGVAQRAFGIQTLPTLVVLSSQGVVTGWFDRSPSDEALRDAVVQARQL